MRARLAAVGVLALLALTSCAQSTSSPVPSSPAPSEPGATPSSPTASSDSATPPPSEGSAICDAAALGQAMEITTTEDAELVQLADVTCADDWAVAVAVSRVTSSTTMQSIVVFQQTPDGWVEQDREGSCTADVVPESLRAVACEGP